MTAIARLIFRISVLQKQSRLLETFFVKIMQQHRVGVARQLFCQFINAGKQWQQIGFRIRRRHRFNGVVQFHERRQNILQNIHASNFTVRCRADNQIRIIAFVKSQVNFSA